MKLSDAIKGHLLDLKISGATEKHIHEVKRELERFRSWAQGQEVLQLEDASYIVLKLYISFLQDLTFSQDDLRISMRGKKVSAVTAQDYMRKVRSFFFWAEREGYLVGPNPVHRVPKMKVPSYIIPTFSTKQLQDLLNACDLSSPLGFRDYAILLTFIDTGIRVTELCTLRIDNIHEGYLTVFGKGSKEREVGLGDTTMRALFKYVHHYRQPFTPDETLVFLSFTGKPLCRKDIWVILHDTSERAGITGVRASPHTLRHSFATQWLQNGGDLASVSLLLGHTEIQTTQIYLKNFQSHEARQHHKSFSPVEKHKLGQRIKKGKGPKKT